MSEAETVPLTIEDGTRAVEIAREAVTSFVESGRRPQLGSMREAFYERTGALVRLESTRGPGRLRGCAGAYRGSEQLGHAIVDAAIEAASEDSCGSEVSAAELPNLRVSVCVVGDLILTDDPVADMQIGTHGVAVEYGSDGGWLWPTVPEEHGWTPEQCLDRTCRVSNLSPTTWQREDALTTLFEGRVFREREPNGSVESL